MILSAKTKGCFIEQTDHAWLLARTSVPAGGPLVIELLREVPMGDAAALEAAFREIQPKKAPSGYLNAVCGVYPARRLLRRTTVELKRVKEPGYFAEVLAQQFRVEPDKFTVHILNAPDGSDFDVAKPTQKEAFFCGLPADDIVAAQDGLLDAGIYPDRLELGSVSMLGGLINYLAWKKTKTPTLVLEIGADITNSFIISASGIETARPIPLGLDAMIPVVQKELGLKDEASAKKLFFSNTFDFTGMGPTLLKRLLKELQSSIGFYEVQTGQSVGQVLCTLLPPKLAWLDASVAGALGLTSLQVELAPWLQARRISISEHALSPGASAGLDLRWFGLCSLMVRYASTDATLAEKKT